MGTVRRGHPHSIAAETSVGGLGCRWLAPDKCCTFVEVQGINEGCQTSASAATATGGALAAVRIVRRSHLHSTAAKTGVVGLGCRWLASDK